MQSAVSSARSTSRAACCVGISDVTATVAALPVPVTPSAVTYRLRVDDCRKTYEQLSTKGVTFLQEPSDRPYGVQAVMRDNTGNWVVLVEPKEFSPDDFS